MFKLNIKYRITKKPEQLSIPTKYKSTGLVTGYLHWSDLPKCEIIRLEDSRYENVYKVHYRNSSGLLCDFLCHKNWLIPISDQLEFNYED